MSNPKSTMDDNIIQAAKILSETPETLKAYIVSPDEISDLNLIGTVISALDVSELETLFEPICNSWGKRVAVAKILKSDTSTSTVEPINTTQGESKLEQLINNMKPIANWSDDELLHSYIETERDDLEAELQRRSKGRRFVVLIDEQGVDIDVPATLVMLKKARKNDIPDMIKSPDGKVTFIYRVEEIHYTNRLRHECPFHEDSILFDDYCSQCEINFDGIELESRQLLRLISASVALSDMDKKNLVQSVRSNKTTLPSMYPRVFKEFNDLKLTGNLPSLVRLEKPKTSNQHRKADPFSISSICDDMNRRHVGI